MPARDGTGPAGQGTRTGRGLGSCQPVDLAKQVGQGNNWWNPLSWLRGGLRSGKIPGRGIRWGAGLTGRGRW